MFPYQLIEHVRRSLDKHPGSLSFGAAPLVEIKTFKYYDQFRTFFNQEIDLFPNHWHMSVFFEDVRRRTKGLFPVAIKSEINYIEFYYTYRFSVLYGESKSRYQIQLLGIEFVEFIDLEDYLLAAKFTSKILLNQGK